MKRREISRQALATHESGHIILISAVSGFSLSDVEWRRLSRYEIAHVEPSYTHRFDWSNPASRNSLIARRVAVALAGAAAESFLTYPSKGIRTIEDVYQLAGSADFELAHEWLTLQQYDPHQRAIECEILRLFRELQEFLAQRSQRDALAGLGELLLCLLKTTDERRLDHLRIDATMLDPYLRDLGTYTPLLQETLIQ